MSSRSPSATSNYAKIAKNVDLLDKRRTMNADRRVNMNQLRNLALRVHKLPAESNSAVARKVNLIKRLQALLPKENSDAKRKRLLAGLAPLAASSCKGPWCTRLASHVGVQQIARKNHSGPLAIQPRTVFHPAPEAVAFPKGNIIQPGIGIYAPIIASKLELISHDLHKMCERSDTINLGRDLFNLTATRARVQSQARNAAGKPLFQERATQKNLPINDDYPRDLLQKYLQLQDQSGFSKAFIVVAADESRSVIGFALCRIGINFSDLGLNNLKSNTPDKLVYVDLVCGSSMYYKGLTRRIMQTVIWFSEVLKARLIVLHAVPTAASFYARFGFERSVNACAANRSARAAKARNDYTRYFPYFFLYNYGTEKAAYEFALNKMFFPNANTNGLVFMSKCLSPASPQPLPRSRPQRIPSTIKVWRHDLGPHAAASVPTKMTFGELVRTIVATNPAAGANGFKVGLVVGGARANLYWIIPGVLDDTKTTIRDAIHRRYATGKQLALIVEPRKPRQRRTGWYFSPGGRTQRSKSRAMHK